MAAAIRRRPWHRPRRRPWAWEALAWAVTKQLIESSRAAQIQRRMVFRWGSRATGPDGASSGTCPTPELIAGCAPAELAAMDLAPARALALIRAAREVAQGRVDPADPAGDRRLLAIREIGPWTVQCLGLYGRGEPDSLPAGDLDFIKLVGRLAGLGRRATVERGGGVLRPLRALSRPRRLPRSSPPTTGGRRRGRRFGRGSLTRAADFRGQSGIWPGSRSLVSTSPVLGSASIRPWSAKNCANRCHCCGSM